MPITAPQAESQEEGTSSKPEVSAQYLQNLQNLVGEMLSEDKGSQ